MMNPSFEAAFVEGDKPFGSLCDRTNRHAQRIQNAVRDAGFDPEILDTLAPSYVAAALILGVK